MTPDLVTVQRLIQSILTLLATLPLLLHTVKPPLSERHPPIPGPVSNPGPKAIQSGTIEVLVQCLKLLQLQGYNNLPPQRAGTYHIALPGAHCDPPLSRRVRSPEGDHRHCL